MWCSRLIAQRARARSRCLSSPQNGAERILNNLIRADEADDAQQRRHFSNGRRHGWKRDDEEKPKSNFAEEYLDPAARGELKEKHSSGIPKLAIRRPKGHEIQGGDEVGFDRGDGEDMLDSDSDDDFRAEGKLVDTMKQDIQRARRLNQIAQASGGGGSTGGGGGNAVALHRDSGLPKDIYNIWGAIESFKDPEYSKEEDFDVMFDRDRAYFRETYGPLSGLTREKLDEIRDGGFNWETPDEFTYERPKGEPSGDPILPEVWKEGCGRRFTMLDYDYAYDQDGNWTGPDYSDFRFWNVHPDSKREPMPYYPRNRTNPHPLIVEFFSRWLYVTNLPPALSEEGMKFGDNPSKLTVRQQQHIQTTVTRQFGVSLDQVYPANETSAFIGFEAPQKRDLVAKRGPSDKVLTRPITASAYTPSEEEKDNVFVKEANAEAIIKLEDIPPHRFTKATLPGTLFPEGTELGAAYSVSSEDVYFQSPTTCLILFDSKEKAESALASESLERRLADLGTYPIRLFQARRNVVHDRMEDEHNEIRRQGFRLIVDGDMPSKEFYISHAGAIMLRNLDRDSVTKEMLADFFQPYSSINRDVKGSVEFVCCLNGLPTDRAYVGFDGLGEAEVVMKALGGRATIGDNGVIMKLVKDRLIPGTPERIARPERTEEEILKNLNDWEQHVDPEDIKWLGEHGVAKEVIDDFLRGLRFHNRSFGPLDWAMRDEKLEPHKESGADYIEMVQMYIETLKECTATPEDPGEVYEHLHFPNEPIDVSIFETEKKRIKKLMKKRAGKL